MMKYVYFIAASVEGILLGVCVSDFVKSPTAGALVATVLIGLFWIKNVVMYILSNSTGKEANK